MPLRSGVLTLLAVYVLGLSSLSTVLRTTGNGIVTTVCEFEPEEVEDRSNNSERLEKRIRPQGANRGCGVCGASGVTTWRVLVSNADAGKTQGCSAEDY